MRAPGPDLVDGGGSVELCWGAPLHVDGGLVDGAESGGAQPDLG